MILVVYPLAAQHDYTELKYSLRSIEKYLPEPFEVVIVGERVPEWITGVTWIQLPDVPGRRQISVRRKILAGLHYSGSEILFMNDDFYFLTQTEIHYFYNGQLKSYAYAGSKQLQERLTELKKPSKHFDLHYPVIFGQDFREIIENFSSECLLRSGYCNYLQMEGMRTAGNCLSTGDCKFLKSEKPESIRMQIKNLPFISTGPASLKSVLPILIELFPKKSRFEL